MKYAQEGDWEWNDAAIMFRQAAELNPKHVMARVKLGLVLAREGRLDEAATNSELALDNYTKAIESTPDDAESYFNRGTAYGQSGRRVAGRESRFGDKCVSAYAITVYNFFEVFSPERLTARL